MLPRLKSDLLALLYAASKGMLDGVDIHWYDRAALCVVMAAAGYPGAYQKGTVIRGLDSAAAIPDTFVFHAGTDKNAAAKSPPMAAACSASAAGAPSIAEAQAKAYQAVDKIDWPEGFCRRDIGWRAIERIKAA